MLTFTYADQSGDHSLTEDSIIDQYFEYWSEKMKSIGKGHLITKAHCIDDFCVVHWATPVNKLSARKYT